VKRVFELRDLVLDHLDPVGLCHHPRARLEQRAPIAISLGWPLISIFILIIGLSMPELVSANPTAGGIYHQALSLGKPVRGWFTGWLNLVGLISVAASVDYGCATLINLTFGAIFSSWQVTLNNAFTLFLIILAPHTIINIWGQSIINALQNIGRR
jgi:amino acid transporter